MNTSTAPTSAGLVEVLVDRTEMVASDVLAIDFVSATDDALPSWTPGAHIDLHLPSGLIRSYSLCGDPLDSSRYRVAVLRVHDGRGGSREVHDIDWTGSGHANTQRSLRISLPRNNFELTDDAGRYLFVAGGIGITPLLPMMARVASAGRPWRLVYGGRSLESMAFRDEIAALPGGQVQLVPQDTDVPIDIENVIASMADTSEAYICGPAGLLDAAQDVARRNGVADRLHLERFSASGLHQAEPNTAFTVELRRSGTTLHVPAHQSILTKVLEVNPAHPWSCEEGICGSCETTVLAGEVDHRDEILDDKERAANDTMFICVSRCRGSHLVLDL